MKWSAYEFKLGTTALGASNFKKRIDSKNWRKRFSGIESKELQHLIDVLERMTGVATRH